MPARYGPPCYGAAPLLNNGYLAMIRMPSFAVCLLLTALLTGWSSRATAAEGHDILLAGGKLAMKADASWKKARPRVSLIQYEFRVPPPDDVAAPGRVTVMAAGGSIEANIERWKKQFRPDEAAPDGNATVEQKTIAGIKVHLVDLTGTFLDRRGPFAPAKERPDYRMLGAIIPTPDDGTFFVKFTGPRKTVGQHEEKFAAMIDSLQWK